MRYEYTYKSRFYQNKLIKMSHAKTKTFFKGMYVCMYICIYIPSNDNDFDVQQRCSS